MLLLAEKLLVSPRLRRAQPLRVSQRCDVDAVASTNAHISGCHGRHDRHGRVTGVVVVVVDGGAPSRKVVVAVVKGGGLGGWQDNSRFKRVTPDGEGRLH